MAIDVELEALLRAPEVYQAPYPPKVITLANGKKLVVREVTREDIPILLDGVRPTFTIERDYYDIVGVRLYAELLGWKRYRVRNEYCIIGQIEGVLVGIANGRLMDKDVGISLHTLTIDRGLRIGAHLFAAKMEHHIEYLGQKEVGITAESPNGLRRFVVDWGLEKQTDCQHELGGATSYRLTRHSYFAAKPRMVVGDRPVPQELMEVATQEIIVADEDTITEKICGLKGR